MKNLIKLLTLVCSALHAQVEILSLGGLGTVRYTYEEEKLLRVERVLLSGKVLYTHTYTWDEDGRLVSEELIGGLGKVEYLGSSIIKSSYHIDVCIQDENQSVMWRRTEDTIHEYDYNDKNELIYDDEEIRCVYDEDGRLIQLEETFFEYDEENRLTGSISDKYLTAYTYDEWGSRRSRTVNGVTEYYVPFRGNDLMVVDERGRPKEIRIPGFSSHPNTLRPIAIETEETIYAPIHDIQGNIVKLVDIFSREVICLEKPDPFGKGLSQNAPVSCIFAGKHYDREEGLVYFGDRYYSPKICQWLTPDPEHQTEDPYQYCFNNPLSYCDPDGRFVIVIPLVFGAITASEILTGAAIATATAWASYELYKRADQLSDACQYWIDNKTRSKDLYPEYEISYRHFSPSTTNYYDDGVFVTAMERSVKKNIDPTLPKDPFTHPEWEDISHPKGSANGHYKFRDKTTGHEIEFDKAKPWETGHKVNDHYHRFNPNSTGDHDKYLDKDGNPARKGSDESHLYSLD